MKRCTLVLILLALINRVSVGQETKNVTVKGIVRDLKTKMPLAAQIKIIYADSNIEIQETIAKGDGSFELKTLQKNCVLQAKADGYIVSNVMMNLENLIITTSVVVEIPLVLSSKSKNNRYIVEFTEKKQGEVIEKEPHSKQVFQALNAVDGSAIAAKFRLIGSDRSDIVNTKTSLEESIFEHSFMKKDNVLLEVTADGYQKFLGNVVIDKFDEIAHENTAKLIKSVSFLNLLIVIKNKAALQNVEIFDNSTQKPVKISRNGDLYFTMLEIDKNYQIKVNNTETGEVLKDFIALEGINQIIINIESKPKAAETAQAEKNVQLEKQAFKSEKKTATWEGVETIYFDQSSCSLKQDAKGILEQISKKMLESPEMKVEIIGHTDNIGDIRQNQYLSEFRAKVISSFLFNKGVKTDRILLKGNGNQNSSTSNETEENRQKNRRAELRFF
jgi:outer membrane protein OmpA-like peptidoglycan-associated protein